MGIICENVYVYVYKPIVYENVGIVCENVYVYKPTVFENVDCVQAWTSQFSGSKKAQHDCQRPSHLGSLPWLPMVLGGPYPSWGLSSTRWTSSSTVANICMVSFSVIKGRLFPISFLLSFKSTPRWVFRTLCWGMGELSAKLLFLCVYTTPPPPPPPPPLLNYFFHARKYSRHVGFRLKTKQRPTCFSFFWNLPHPLESMC